MKKVAFWGILLLGIFVATVTILGIVSRVFGFKWDIIDNLGVGTTLTLLAVILIAVILTFIFGIKQMVRELWRWANR